MCTASEALAGGISGGQTIVCGCLDNYYASIGTFAGDETLEGYCRHFRRQMATWTCVPLLLATKMTDDDGFHNAVQSAFEHFGTAWRLLDDLQDAAVDGQSGHHSAVYCALPEAAKAAWDQGHFGGGDLPSPSAWPADQLDHVAAVLTGRIGRELATAAATLDAIGLTALADEMRCLAAPFGSGQAAR